MFTTLRRSFAVNSAEVFHMTNFSHITHRWLPLYLENDTTIDADSIKILRQYLTSHVNDMWKKYL